MFTHVDYIIIMVSDMARSVEFYRDQLGLALKFQSPDWTEFQTGATTLALHGGGTPREPSAGGDQGKSYAGTGSIGFTVRDLESTVEELKSRGVPFVMPPTQREGEGLKLAVCVDPDGLPISFAQMLYDAA
jgi:lactoylglutathione lyase